MITSDVIFLLALALFNLFAAGLCYHNIFEQIEENKSPIFWYLMTILNLACAIQNAIWALALLG
jgi:hypothetical protein